MSKSLALLSGTVLACATTGAAALVLTAGPATGPHLPHPATPVSLAAWLWIALPAVLFGNPWIVYALNVFVFTVWFATCILVTAAMRALTGWLDRRRAPGNSETKAAPAMLPGSWEGGI